MNQLAPLYDEHLAGLQQQLAEVLARENIDGLAIFSGIGKRLFLDDHDYPFKVNPQFKRWLPVIDNPWCMLWVDGVNTPRLFYYLPSDYWHASAADPGSLFWARHFDIQRIATPAELAQRLPRDKSGWAFVGEEVDWAREQGFDLVNPQAALNALDFQRAFKSDYEQECQRRASAIAVQGHKAAAEAFYASRSEFAIHLAYLAATNQAEHETPYGNIVALNENAATLHYTLLARKVPPAFHSFLLDAGAGFHGYAADISRSYAARPDSVYANLIQAMDQLQQSVIAAIKPGQTDYIDLNELTHRKLAQVLVDFDLVSVSADDAFGQGITRTFLPHGLGHLLGLQVHDAGGFMQDSAGTVRPAPKRYPALRLTRTLQPGMVVTIEPGIYFIETLLSALRETPAGKGVNWSAVDSLRPFGGIRIEDNIIIHPQQVENITREQGLH